MNIHASDCSVHDNGECDCGDLDLAVYDGHSFIPALIPSTGRFGFFVNHMGRECFIEPEYLPSSTLAAIASAANLPDAHNIVSLLSSPNGMNLDNTRETVITQLQALAVSQGVASNF